MAVRAIRKATVARFFVTLLPPNANTFAELIGRMQNYVFADGNSIQNFCLGLVSLTNPNGTPACPVVVDNKDAPSVALAKCRTCGDL
jgi:hypothetical protein